MPNVQNCFKGLSEVDICFQCDFDLTVPRSDWLPASHPDEP